MAYSGAVSELIHRSQCVRRESQEVIRNLRDLRAQVARTNQCREPFPTLADWRSHAQPASHVVALVASAGGIKPLIRILSDLPPAFPATVLVLLHRSSNTPSVLPELLGHTSLLPVREARGGDRLRDGQVLVAPGGTHLCVTAAGTTCLRGGERINFVWPSADVLFESLAAAYRERVVAVVLSGAGSDGAMGTRAIRRMGGTVIAQRQDTAQYAEMPLSAIDVGQVDLVLPLHQIAFALGELIAGSN